jgi:tRNA-dihydrouridine synthase
MKIYYAPMEGITLYPLRNVHKEVFGDDVDRYYTPFLTAVHTHHFKNREKKDILPEVNRPFGDYTHRVIPQIMAGNAADFLWAAGEIGKLGYREVNLNLGCPAPTVVNRHKGAGLLTDTDYLKEMLSDIYEGVTAERKRAEDAGEECIMPEVSLKTRLGFSDEAEADRLMEIYAGFPVKELTIHARVRQDLYAGKPRIDAFNRAVSVYRNCGGEADICYNGNAEDLKELPEDIAAVMLGRGMLADPALARRIKGGAALLPQELREYLDKLYEGFASYIPEDRNVIFKMLEHWAFLHVHFKDCDKQLKNIRKSRARGEYQAAVNRIFAECEFI